MCVKVVNQLSDPVTFAKLYQLKPHAMSLLRQIREHFTGKIVLYGNYPSETGFQEHFPEIAEMIDLPYLSGTIGMVKTNPGFSKVTPFPPRSTLCIETQPEHCHKMYTCEVIEHDGRSLLKILAAYGICKPSLISSQLIRENHFQVETKEKQLVGKILKKIGNQS